MRSILSLIMVAFALPLGGCAVVDATANVVSATGSLVGAAANTTAGAVRTVSKAAGGGSSSSKPKTDASAAPADCTQNKDAPSCPQPQHYAPVVSSEPQY